MKTSTLLPLIALFAAASASAKEYPIGEPQQCAGMEVGAVYLQPIEMDPPGMMRPATESDVHMEADISALESNRHGFQEGSFVPYLSISYTLQRVGSDKLIQGEFHAMVASDGPHYGDNVKLDGPGKYRLTYRVAAPGGGHHAFGRHTDKETGVAPWFEPCELEYNFTYAGIGKKGGY
ncbi:MULTISPECIES: iron transporter [unclassified Pseudomonas]|uniref:iron transporter n=1 Tax=unclassified Pseudomonas TaxID=196821 RepID=UPI002449E9FF|nr:MULTISPECIES: iron transporter [unclassified Pseudomonas]MDG9927226.1 iron transporter [Pseudomonas sp. GD04042]MDH0485301.1 iron transporter [Pseudomonas sp. GD04015]MDH0602648.1 iron transporter [Pseudomonas sp. GD03869]